MKLEIGTGGKPIGRDGWSHLDPPRFVWGDQRIPLDDGSVTEFFSSHCIEHLDWRIIDPALTELARVMAPGASIEIWTLDLRALVDAYLAGKCGDNWRRSNPNSDPFRWFVARLHSYGPPDGDLHNWHRSQWDRPNMRRYLERAGFVDVRFLRPDERTRGVSHGRCEFGTLARRA